MFALCSMNKVLLIKAIVLLKLCFSFFWSLNKLPKSKYSFFILRMFKYSFLYKNLDIMNNLKKYDDRKIFLNHL